MNNYTAEQKEQVCDIVSKWMIEHVCYNGEQAAQSDECTINAIDLVCDLADVVGVPYNFED